MEDIVLLVCCFLMFQSITGCKSLAGEAVHLVRVLTVVCPVIVC